MIRKEEEVDKIKKYWYHQQVTIRSPGFGDMFSDKNLEFHQNEAQKNENFIVVQNHQRKQPRLIYRTQFQNTEDKERIYLFYETRVEFNPLYYL